MKSFVYFIRCEASGLIKIGYSTDLQGRVASLLHANPRGVALMASAPGGAVAEAAVHKKFRELRVRGEWFRTSPALLSFIEQVKRNGALGLTPDTSSVDVALIQTAHDESAEFRASLAAALRSRLMPFSHVTQKALAQGIGATRHSVNNWVNQKCEPSAYLVGRIHNYLTASGQPGFLSEIYGDLAEPKSKRRAAE